MKWTLSCSRKAWTVAFILAFLVVSASLPQAQATTFTQNRSLRFDTFAEIHGALNWFGWSNSTETYGSSYGQYSWGTSNRTIRYGFRIFRFNYTDVDFTYAENQIGTGTNVIGQRSQSAEGYQSTTWTSPEANLTRLDSLEIRFYTSYLIVGSTWSAWSTFLEHANVTTLYFLTEPLGMTTLKASTWNLTIYTYKFWNPTGWLYSRIYWGNATYNSRIENIQLDDGVTGLTDNDMNTHFVVGGTLGGVVVAIFSFAYFITAAKARKNKPDPYQYND